jgi:hypothetical protein
MLRHRVLSTRQHFPAPLHKRERERETLSAFFVRVGHGQMAETGRGQGGCGARQRMMLYIIETGCMLEAAPDKGCMLAVYYRSRLGVCAGVKPRSSAEHCTWRNGSGAGIPPWQRPACAALCGARGLVMATPSSGVEHASFTRAAMLLFEHASYTLQQCRATCCRLNVARHRATDGISCSIFAEYRAGYETDRGRG